MCVMFSRHVTVVVGWSGKVVGPARQTGRQESWLGLCDGYTTPLLPSPPPPPPIPLLYFTSSPTTGVICTFSKVASSRHSSSRAETRNPRLIPS